MARRKAATPPRRRPRARSRLANRVADQPGTSAGSRSPCRRQPVVRSQVRARATGARTRRAADSSARDRPLPHPPAVEPFPRGGGIEADGSLYRGPRLPDVVARIQEHVAQRVVHLARRPQQPVVIALRQYGSTMLGHPVDRTRESRPDALHPAPQRRLVSRFDDEVRMVSLKRVLHQAKPGPLAPDGKRATDLVHDRHRPERRHPFARAQRDVRRQRPTELFPRKMPYQGLGPGFRPAPRARATPPRSKSSICLGTSLRRRRLNRRHGRAEPRAVPNQLRARRRAPFQPTLF